MAGEPRPKATEPLGEDLQDRRSGTYDNVAPKPTHPGRENATEHEKAQGAAIPPETEPPDESMPSGLRRPRKGPLGLDARTRRNARSRPGYASVSRYRC
jgi:hypothetical protein